MRYFSQIDFDRCNPPCNIEQMRPYFLEILDDARHIAKIPFVPTSAYRSVEHEIQKGRKGTSSHTKGIAIDLKANTGREKFLIVSSLIKCGVTRIGIYKTFIHADIDEEKPDKVIW